MNGNKINMKNNSMTRSDDNDDIDNMDIDGKDKPPRTPPGMDKEPNSKKEMVKIQITISFPTLFCRYYILTDRDYK